MKTIINFGLSLAIGTSIILSGCFESTTQNQSSSDLRVVVSGDGNETISPTISNTQPIKSGSTLTFTITPKTGYTVVSNNTCGAGSWNGNVYTFGPMTQGCNIHFSATNKYTVTPSVDSHLTVSPITAQTVYNTPQSFTITSSNGYGANTSVNGTCPAGSWNRNVYTTGAITSNCTVNFSSGVIPTVGSAIRFSNVTTSGFDMSWGAALDSNDSPNTLQYRVVKASSSSAINSVLKADAITGSGVVQDWTMNITAASVSGLTAGDFNYYAVEVKNSRGVKAIYPAVPRVAGKMIYISTSGITNSNSNGIDYMDALCKSSANPSADQGAILTAIISDGVNRIACTSANCSSGDATENVNWPLQANTTYYNWQGQTLGTTSNAGIFTSNLSNSIYPSLIVVTGLQSDWTSSNNNCGGWTNFSSGQLNTGSASQTAISSLLQSPNLTNCTALATGSYRLLCVEN